MRQLSVFVATTRRRARPAALLLGILVVLGASATAALGGRASRAATIPELEVQLTLCQRQLVEARQAVSDSEQMAALARQGKVILIGSYPVRWKT